MHNTIALSLLTLIIVLPFLTLRLGKQYSKLKAELDNIDSVVNGIKPKKPNALIPVICIIVSIFALPLMTIYLLVQTNRFKYKRVLAQIKLIEFNNNKPKPTYTSSGKSNNIIRNSTVVSDGINFGNIPKGMAVDMITQAHYNPSPFN